VVPKDAFTIFYLNLNSSRANLQIIASFSVENVTYSENKFLLDPNKLGLFTIIFFILPYCPKYSVLLKI